MVSGIVTDGLADLLIQYFKLLFNFSVQDVVSASIAPHVVHLNHLQSCWASLPACSVTLLPHAECQQRTSP